MPDRVKALDKRQLIAAIPKDEILNAMSPTLRAIADVSSLDAALALAHKHGGRRVHFPRKGGEYSPLAHSVGAEDARRIVAEFGGVYVDMPQARFLKKLMVKFSSATAARLAEALGITERYVRMIRANQRNQCAGQAGAKPARPAMPPQGPGKARG